MLPSLGYKGEMGFRSSMSPKGPQGGTIVSGGIFRRWGLVSGPLAIFGMHLKGWWILAPPCHLSLLPGS